MLQSAIDVDFGEWRAGFARLLRGGTFSGRDGERGQDTDTDTTMAKEQFDVPQTSFEDSTALMTSINQTSTANQYLLSVVSAENARLKRLDENAQRDLYRLREQSLSVVYGADLCGFLAVVIKIVLVAAMLILGVISATAQQVVSRRSGIILSVLVTLIFGFILLCMCISAANRRNDAWGHYYWNAGTAKFGSTVLPTANLS